ncbi:hypothetical protein GIB67_013457 [Kingdonia uniflora]|uniref:Uncharacterized protein n=1 Tax=Kingdonia uniflora TaxID=39325 RepID=A0A7J7LR33_9MAGN|nr:hypothetical protein GIB67_013457 [Kingdonia uniflora]
MHRLFDSYDLMSFTKPGCGHSIDVSAVVLTHAFPTGLLRFLLHIKEKSCLFYSATRPCFLLGIKERAVFPFPTGLLRFFLGIKEKSFLSFSYIAMLHIFTYENRPVHRSDSEEKSAGETQKSLVDEDKSNEEENSSSRGKQFHLEEKSDSEGKTIEEAEEIPIKHNKSNEKAKTKSYTKADSLETNNKVSHEDNNSESEDVQLEDTEKVSKDVSDSDKGRNSGSSSSGDTGDSAEERLSTWKSRAGR